MIYDDVRFPAALARTVKDNDCSSQPCQQRLIFFRPVVIVVVVAANQDNAKHSVIEFI